MLSAAGRFALSTQLGVRDDSALGHASHSRANTAKKPWPRGLLEATVFLLSCDYCAAVLSAVVSDVPAALLSLGAAVSLGISVAVLSPVWTWP